MTRHAQSYDANHGAIVAALRAVPCYRVLDLAAYGAPYDLLVTAPAVHRAGWVAVLADVKISARATLTPAQAAARDEGWLRIWTTVDEALADVEAARGAA